MSSTTGEKVAVGVGVAAAAGLGWLAWRVRSIVEPVRTAWGLDAGQCMAAAQAAMVLVIEGWSNAAATGALANAWAESRLEASATAGEKSGSSSRGIWQLNNASGALGDGVADMVAHSPFLSTQVVAREAARQGVDRSSSDPAAVARQWAELVEKPEDVAEQSDIRAEYARQVVLS